MGRGSSEPPSLALGLLVFEATQGTAPLPAPASVHSGRPPRPSVSLTVQGKYVSPQLLEQGVGVPSQPLK